MVSPCQNNCELQVQKQSFVAVCQHFNFHDTLGCDKSSILILISRIELLCDSYRNPSWPYITSLHDSASKVTISSRDSTAGQYPLYGTMICLAQHMLHDPNTIYNVIALESTPLSGVYSLLLKEVKLARFIHFHVFDITCPLIKTCPVYHT